MWMHLWNRRIRLTALSQVLPLLVLLLSGCGAGGRAALPPGAAAGEAFIPDPVLQRLIDPRPVAGGLSWLGGDVAASVAVSEDHYVWIFGDSLIGHVADRCPDARRYCDRRLEERDVEHGMIPNSAGVMRRAAGGEFAPLVTYWRNRDGVPAPIFEPADPDEFLWPLAMVHAEGQLLVAANRHTRDSGLFALGNVFLRVRNPEDPPDAWTYGRQPIPHVVDYRQGPVPLTWTTALVAVDEWIYVVGSDGVGGAARMVLARFPAKDLAQPGWKPELEYWLETPPGGAGGVRTLWSRTFDRDRLHAVPGLAGTSEAVFTFNEDWGWYTFQIDPLSFDVRMYSAPVMEGPWRDRGLAYRIPAPWSTERIACPSVAGDCPLRFGAYAAKAHPELAAWRSVPFALSYNVNVSDGSGHAAKHAAESVHGFYVPQLVSGGLPR